MTRTTYRRTARQLLLVLLAMALLATGVVGCGGGDGSSGGGDPTPAAAEVPFDRAFIDAMIPHHESAVAMAEVALQRGLDSPELRQLAEDIVIAQQAEINQMREWRTAWYGTGSDPSALETLGLNPKEAGMDHDVAELRRASDVDATFASMMIPHHEGAIRMAKLAEEQARHPEVRGLAQRIVEAQEQEIELLEPHASGHHG